MMRLKGSYTVEAAVIVSLYLFMAAAAMKAGIELYQEIAAEGLTYSKELHPEEEFYTVTMLEKIKEAAEEKGKGGRSGE